MIWKIVITAAAQRRTTLTSHQPAATLSGWMWWIKMFRTTEMNCLKPDSRLIQANWMIYLSDDDELSCSLYLNSKCIRKYHSTWKHICIFRYLLYCVWTVNAYNLFVYNPGFEAELTMSVWTETESCNHCTNHCESRNISDSQILSKVLFLVLRRGQKEGEGTIIFK